MSKVVHVSDDLHLELKKFCKERGLRMSEWVMNLVKTAMRQDRDADGIPTITPRAITSAPREVTAPSLVSAPPLAAAPRPPMTKRKPIQKYERPTPADLEEIYSAPPFWERAGA